MSKKTEQIALEAPKVRFDPSKQWQWKMEDEIIFSGREFMVINQALSQFIQSGLHDIPMILKLTEAFATVQSKLAEYVDKGVIKEYVPIPPVGLSE